jgi:hypothetical protein
MRDGFLNPSPGLAAADRPVTYKAPEAAQRIHP